MALNNIFLVLFKICQKKILKSFYYYTIFNYHINSNEQTTLFSNLKVSITILVVGGGGGGGACK